MSLTNLILRRFHLRERVQRWRDQWELSCLQAQLDDFLDDPANSPPNACCPWCKGGSWLSSLLDQISILRVKLTASGVALPPRVSH